MLQGRQVCWTNEKYVDETNVIKVLLEALPTFLANKSECEYLIKYDKGNQPLQRVKVYRSDINIVDIDNVANEITVFKQGFHWGNPITLISRGNKDSRKIKDPEGIALLNECYSTEADHEGTQELGYYVEVTGICFTFLDINMGYEDGDSFFKWCCIPPTNAFIVRCKTTPDHNVVMGVTFAEDTNGNRYFTAFTKNKRFEIVGERVVNGGETDYTYLHGNRSGEENPLNIIPIVEWFRSHDRMGAWERQIPDMDALNILESDYANQVDQNVQAIWHGNDISFPEDENGNKINPESNDWVITETTKSGKTPFIKPLAIQSDYAGMLNNIRTKRALILQKCNVPQRNDNSGGSTGVAMSDATGWSNAEVEATMLQGIMEKCKQQEVKIALACIKNSPFVEQDNPILKLRYCDVKASIKRQKSYEMSTKANTYAALVKHGIHPLHALNVVNLFDDVQQVYEDSKDTLNLFQESIFNNNKLNNTENDDKKATEDIDIDTSLQDESDQTDNSPVVDKNRG